MFPSLDVPISMYHHFIHLHSCMINLLKNFGVVNSIIGLVKALLLISCNQNQGIRGAMVARLTPDQKVACSIHVGFNSQCFAIPHSFYVGEFRWQCFSCERDVQFRHFYSILSLSLKKCRWNFTSSPFRTRKMSIFAIFILHCLYP